MADDEFNWAESEVAIPGQLAVAVYTNQQGDCVIRQEGDNHPDEDTWIVVHRKNVRSLIIGLEAWLKGQE